MYACRKIARLTSTAWRLRSTEESLVPVPRRLEAALELPARLPAKLGADRRRIEVLAVDCPVRRPGSAHVGLERAAGDLDQRAHDVDHGHGPVPPRVPHPALELRPLEGGRHGEVGVDRILHVEEVTLRPAVGA